MSVKLSSKEPSVKSLKMFRDDTPDMVCSLTGSENNDEKESNGRAFESSSRSSSYNKIKK